MIRNIVTLPTSSADRDASTERDKSTPQQFCPLGYEVIISGLCCEINA